MNRNRENCVESGTLIECNPLSVVVSRRIFINKLSYTSKLDNCSHLMVTHPNYHDEIATKKSESELNENKSHSQKTDFIFNNSINKQIIPLSGVNELKVENCNHVNENKGKNLQSIRREDYICNKNKLDEDKNSDILIKNNDDNHLNDINSIIIEEVGEEETDNKNYADNSNDISKIIIEESVDNTEIIENKNDYQL